ncbi:MAG TPA: hypothetical protein VFQ53_39680 [Kofleriaceae bacterium]|nr:hypothetical protein [Kofleriaceae bacterium]
MLVLAACSGGDDDGGGGPTVDAAGSGGGSAACTVTATATPDPAQRTITGVGAARCDRAASLALEVCVQWNPSGTFEDLMCLSSSRSGVSQLDVENLASCGIATGRRFRARVVATVDGAAQPAVLSSETGCE